MAHHKFPSNFYKASLPVRMWYNWKTKYWRLLDNNNTIIADGLTKELADTLVQAVNFCSTAINFTKSFVEGEYMMGYFNDLPVKTIARRSEMYDSALKFMIDLGIIEPPPTYINAFPLWRKQIMNDFHQTIDDQRYKKVNDEDEDCYYDEDEDDKDDNIKNNNEIDIFKRSIN